MTPMAIHRLHVVHLYKCLDRKAATGLCHLWLPENPALPWSCAIALASPCLNAPHPLVVSPNVWCAWWKASKMVQRSCLKPTWHLKSSKLVIQDFPFLIHPTNMDKTRVLCWTLTVVLPLQPGHLAKSCTIFASKSLRIPRKLSWVSAALAKPQVVVHLSTLRCTKSRQNMDNVLYSWMILHLGVEIQIYIAA